MGARGKGVAATCAEVGALGARLVEVVVAASVWATSVEQGTYIGACGVA